MNQRRKGIRYELEVKRKLEKLSGKKEFTNRHVSKFRDDQKCDIDFDFNNLKLNIQCKSQSTRVPYEKILNEMPKDDRMNVIFHKFTKKATKNFIKVGEYVVLSVDDFIKLIQ